MIKKKNNKKTPHGTQHNKTVKQIFERKTNLNFWQIYLTPDQITKTIFGQGLHKEKLHD